MTTHTSQKNTEDAKKMLVDYLQRVDQLKAKDRTLIPPQEMQLLDPELRSHTLDEVAIGFTADQARIEALRCLQCIKKTCVEDCPVSIDIPGFIHHIATGEFENAASVIRQTSLLPSICGRVCPQETQCQAHCTVGRSLKDVDNSVAIGHDSC